jgi:uncharacterized protein YjbI with pentapeptide repeats
MGSATATDRAGRTRICTRVKCGETSGTGHGFLAKISAIYPQISHDVPRTMETPDPDSSQPKPLVPASSEEIKALLDAGNQASEKVAVLHVAFMAVCAYVLIVVFGTTDLDLLVGKGVKLPVVDVEVPILGFYVFAPYLVVLVHFNLLLQLQLLSRKLYIFDAAIQATPDIGGARDRLHIFPYTYYLVGQTRFLVQRFLSIVVVITLLLLPLATLLILQLRFLAYQDELSTWTQRTAVWADVALVVALWPVIMDRKDNWQGYMRRVWHAIRRWSAFKVTSLVAFFVSLLATSEEASMFALLVWLVLALLDVFVNTLRGRLRWRWFRELFPKINYLTARGMTGLVVVIVIGLPLPLSFAVDGERLERCLGVSAFSKIVSDLGFRSLDLRGQRLFAKPPASEMLEQVRQDDFEKVRDALPHVEGINLKDRSLRDANLFDAILVGAKLNNAHLEGAKLQNARLDRANLYGAQMVGAILQSARLREADLRNTNLKDANLRETQLQRSDLRHADLQGADLHCALLTGANFTAAQRIGAKFDTPGQSDGICEKNDRKKSAIVFSNGHFSVVRGE